MAALNVSGVACMDGIIRPYSRRKDRSNVYRLWKECGWPTEEPESADALMKSGTTFVYELNGSAESLVISVPALLHYAGTALDHAAVAAVGTSRVARNLGAATGTLAAMLSAEASRGAATSGLGVFEQGFYNRLGYGTGTYEHWAAFDPAWLVDLPVSGAPQRFEVKQYKAVHQARLDRRKSHGAVDVLSPEITKADMLARKNTFCIGYTQGKVITHCLVVFCAEVERGPYTVMWMSYPNLRELRELLGLIRGLGDQVRQVRLHEPAEIQIQDFLQKPFQLQSISRKGVFEAGIKAMAYWQIRILDLAKCIRAMKCRGELQFNLVIEDPVAAFLPQGSEWKGCGGSYAVALGAESSINAGAVEGLDTLTASIGDFSRYWLGVKSAAVLNVTGVFDGPERLLEKLDAVNPLPSPAPEWDY